MKQEFLNKLLNKLSNIPFERKFHSLFFHVLKRSKIFERILQSTFNFGSNNDAVENQMGGSKSPSHGLVYPP